MTDLELMDEQDPESSGGLHPMIVRRVPPVELPDQNPSPRPERLCRCWVADFDHFGEQYFFFPERRTLSEVEFQLSADYPNVPILRLYPVAGDAP